MNEEPKLTNKQQAFVQEYLIDLNGSKAAERAGYSKNSARVIAVENLTKPLIVSAIQAAMDKRAKKTDITAEYVLTTIKQTIDRCAQAEPVMVKDGDQWVPSGEYRFEYTGVLKGCELLGKHLKLFSDKIEHTGPDGGPIQHEHSALSPQERRERIQRLEAKLLGSD